MSRSVLLAAALCCAALPTTMIVAASSAFAAGRMLTANTAVPCKLEQELSSKTNKQGDRFNVTVTEDVMADGRVVIPKGTPGVGVITLLKEKGAFGRSGKLETQLLYITLNGKQVELTGQKNDKGKGGTAGTVAVAVVAGVFSAFVTGKSAVLPVGTTLLGYTKTDAVI